MGVRLAKAMRPKPSSMGLRPRMVDASPTPRAVMSGTVMVLVVTPPRVVRHPDDLLGREDGHYHDQGVPANDEAVDGPPLHDAQHSQDDCQADGNGHHQAQLKGVAFAGGRPGCRG